jgi:hypothetical protein
MNFQKLHEYIVFDSQCEIDHIKYPISPTQVAHMLIAYGFLITNCI